jgi:N utilization substance protein B
MAATSAASEVSAPQERARPRTSARHKARKHALDLLFESDLRGTDPVATLEERAAAGEVTVRDLTSVIVRGVAENMRQIDATVSEHLADGWTLDRMPRVDRIIARIATYELLFTATAPNVVVSEAVTLASELSTDESPAFVNAVLSGLVISGPPR